MTDKKEKRPWGDWFLIFLGSAVGLVAVLQLLGKVGLINDPFPPVPKQPERPHFDRAECLSRNAYRIREADPMIPDEMLHGDVARACVLEQREFEGW